MDLPRLVSFPQNNFRLEWTWAPSFVSLHERDALLDRIPGADNSNVHAMHDEGTPHGYRGNTTGPTRWSTQGWTQHQCSTRRHGEPSRGFVYPLFDRDRTPDHLPKTKRWCIRESFFDVSEKVDKENRRLGLPL
jgi:hypothetical protein